MSNTANIGIKYINITPRYHNENPCINDKSGQLINENTKISRKNICYDDNTKNLEFPASVVSATLGDRSGIRESNLCQHEEKSSGIEISTMAAELRNHLVSKKNIDTDSDDDIPPPPPPPLPLPLLSSSTSFPTSIIDSDLSSNPIPPSKSNQNTVIIQKKSVKEESLILSKKANDRKVGRGSSDQLSSISHITIQEMQSWDLLGLTLKYLSVLKQRYNPSQLDAIQKSLGSSGFTLIQGPPGTGKTFTILGILNSFHIREYNKYYRMAVDIFLSDEGIRCRNSKNSESWLKLISKISKSKPHILAVAPSNVAVDNLVQRIMEKGFIDGRGGRYNPTILRLGMGRGCKVKSVSLEDTLEEEQAYFNDEKNTHNFSKDIEKHINSLILQIFSVQTYLINLKLAFKSHPLPVGWELRVAEGTGIPYWIDHINRVSSPIPPARPPIGVVLGFLTFETLPEYMIHEQKFTQLLDQLDRQNLIYTRYKARVALLSHRGDASARQVSDDYCNNEVM